MVLNYQAIADTIGTSNFNYFNCLGNMFLARAGAQNAMMFNSMQSCWTGFMPYGNLSGTSVLTDPRFTIAQMTWGTPMWNSNWTMDPDMWAPWGFINNGGDKTNTKKPDTEEEKKYQKKYNVLLSLLKQLKDYSELSATKKELIEDAINNAKKGTYEEKYNALMTAYKAIGKDDVKEFFAVADKLGATSDIKGDSQSDDSFKNRLKAVGHEADDSETESGTDKIVEQLFIEVEKLNDADATSSFINGQTGNLVLDSTNILDLISSWNSEHKNKTDESNRLLNHVMKKHDDLDDEDAQKDIRICIVSPFVKALVREAERNQKNLTAESKTNMENAIKNLEKELEEYETDGKNGEEVSEAFDNLYVLTRLAATEKLEAEVIDYYSRIEEDSDMEDSDKVFKDGMFTEAMIEDLEKEGFTSATIENAKKTVRRKGDESPEPNPPAAPEAPPKTDPKSNESIRTAGAELREILVGYTEKDDYITVNETLKNVNKNNVMSFLAGYYEDAKGMDRVEGLIERLDDENDGCGTDRAIEMKNKVNVIDSLLDLAEEKGLTDNVHYKAIKRVIDARFETKELDKTRTNFKKGSRAKRFFTGKNWYGQTSTYVGGTVAAIGVGVGILCSGPIGLAVAVCGALAAGWGILCDSYTDDEFIDDHMEALYKDIKALEQQPTLSATA